MKKTVLFMAIMLAAILALGPAAGASARGEEDDLGWWPGAGMGPGMEAEPGPGMGMGPAGEPGMGPGRGGRRQDVRQQHLERIKKEDPERYRRLMKIKELATEYWTIEDEKKKAKIEKELKPLVDKELKVQHQENKKRIKMIEKRLERAKKVLEKREKNWDRVVDYTVEEITGQNDYLKAWPGKGRRR